MHELNEDEMELCESIIKSAVDTAVGKILSMRQGDMVVIDDEVRSYMVSVLEDASPSSDVRDGNCRGGVDRATSRDSCRDSWYLSSPLAKLPTVAGTLATI